MKTKKKLTAKTVFKRTLIVITTLAVLLMLYILIYNSVIAFSPGVTITEEMISNTRYIQPNSNETLYITKDTIYLSKDLNVNVIKNRELLESIVSYEYEEKIYYFKFITQDKIYSTQFRIYLYKAW